MTTKLEIAENFAKTINSDKIKLMILFGSVARGDYRPDSDIDILVVSDYHEDIWPKIDKCLGINTFERDYSFLTNVLKEGIILEGN